MGRKLPDWRTWRVNASPIGVAGGCGRGWMAACCKADGFHGAIATVASRESLSGARPTLQCVQYEESRYALGRRYPCLYGGNMYDTVQRLLNQGVFSVVEQFTIPGRIARFGPIPRFLFDSRVGLYLHRKFESSKDTTGPLWSHQTEALDKLGRGEDVVVSTGTASGKSLIFRSLAFHKTLLNPRSRVLVFYPLKALAADQLLGWIRMARDLDLDDSYVGRVDGSVSVKDREEILQRARVVAMTPDVCHAWLMSRLSLPIVRDFLRSLSTLVMDEAHILEGVFGSNFAFLMRRLMAARYHLIGPREMTPLQLVAATATIKNPGEHLRLLTGAEFSVVDHQSDGAPEHERLVAHVDCPVGEETSVAKSLHERVLSEGREGGFITFLDSRKGVEGLAMASDGSKREDYGAMIDHADVLPYRAGYDAKDRMKIEERLQSGSLRGVVSTSALELGIDVPHLRVGFNIGVPESRKAYRQRLGRIGRTAPGAFVIIGAKDSFARYGTSFREYHDMSVEQSYLYLDNRFMQFAHGRCLADELESIGSLSKTPARVPWPFGFEDMHAAARPGASRPPEFDAIAALGGDSPQYGYPLRNVGETNFQIKMNANADAIGEVSQQQALRECYPGATYLHLTRAYQVAAWHTSSFESFIRVRATSPARRTRPRITTWINAGITSTDILEGHLVQNQNGLLAECLMQVTQRVEGYVDVRSGEIRTYKELQQRNPNMRARMRNFRTTGVLLILDVFKRNVVKRAFVDRLRDVFVREYSIAPRDVSGVASNISIRSREGGGVRRDCIAVYDETYGSLRLTERLFLHFDEILDRLLAAVRDSADEDELPASAVKDVRRVYLGFAEENATTEISHDPPIGLMQVFVEGSRVCFQQSGQMAVEVEVIQPTMMEGILMYQISTPQRPGQPPSKRWVPANYVEPSAEADGWSYALWDPITEQYVNDVEESK